MNSDTNRAITVEEEAREKLSELKGMVGALTFEQAFRLQAVLRMLSDLIESKLRDLVLDGESSKKTDANEELLSAKRAAELLNVSEDWMYRHADGLPFTKRLSRKALRFRKNGLLEYRDSNRKLMEYRPVTGIRGLSR
jgi:hypothetical protein